MFSHAISGLAFCQSRITSVGNDLPRALGIRKVRRFTTAALAQRRLWRSAECGQELCYDSLELRHECIGRRLQNELFDSGLTIAAGEIGKRIE
jgi:hypothetical protein